MKTPLSDEGNGVEVYDWMGPTVSPLPSVILSAQREGPLCAEEEFRSPRQQRGPSSLRSSG